ncbi:MAG: NAD-dependent epimerase/dehydratase family protein [Methylocella sp.]
MTGGAGFIGSAVVRHLIHDTGHEVWVLDKLTMRASPGRVPNLSVERDIFTASILVRAYVVAEGAKCASRSYVPCPWELR